ncbi:MAG: AAA family ATPase [Bacteroidota bacterium]|nr:AAA family ATPase [Bacteroidota bacterium]
MKDFIFPNIQKVHVKHFSLYKTTDFLDIDLSKDVFCLAGANGLGKSTFITLVNYCLTGIVKHPERKFTWYNEITKFYNQSKGFAATYFDGRIIEEDYDLAEVTIEFFLGKATYTITRGFFEPDELRNFSKFVDGKQIEINSDLTFSELNELYKTNFVKDVNLSQFDQFVFLQTYVFTFDETHQLLFWDESIMERVLYLFFGVDSDKAKLADKLRKEFNKGDSDFRNLQWQITRTRNELNGILKKAQAVNLENTENIEIYEHHRDLIEQGEQLISEANDKREDIRECDLKISDYSLAASNLRSEYEQIFNRSLNDDTPIESNVEIVRLLNDLKLRIFSSKEFSDILESIVEVIQGLKYQQENVKQDQYFESLSKIDTQLASLSKDINDYQTRKDRLIKEELDILNRQKSLNLEITAIESQNEELIRSIHKLKQDQNFTTLIKSYEEQIARYSEQKDESYTKRENAKNKLSELEKDLNKGYIAAESKFIPIFNDYAKSFLGLDIAIQLSSSAKGPNLSLNIKDSRRRVAFQLSESQRYFIDIALRMALIDLSTKSATLLIDTPEGSLDIAYESRAGKMLADFAKQNHKIIMTANINSSQLLLELATLCRSERMTIERMTNWTILSEVQQQENDRIEAAYAKIEGKLNGSVNG